MAEKKLVARKPSTKIATTVKQEPVVIDVEEYEVSFPTLKPMTNPLTGREDFLIPKSYIARQGALSRAEVEARFHATFELIGGISRFALWADANPEDFYKFYAKMVPPPLPLPVVQPVQQQAPSSAIQINLSNGQQFPSSPLDDIQVRSESEVNKNYREPDLGDDDSE